VLGRPDLRAAAVLAAGVGYAAAASPTRPLTVAAAVAVALPAAVVVVCAGRRPRSGPGPARTRLAPGRPPGPGPEQTRSAPEGRSHSRQAPSRSPLRRTALAWTVLAAAVAAVELIALMRQPAYDVASPDHPTISVLLDPLTSAGPSRFVLWCGWLGLGWLAARR